MFDAEAVRRQVLLQVRNTYLQLALAAEQTVLLSDALNLSLAQYNDIKVNVEAGTKSRSDKLSSHQDLLSKERSLSQARADMAQSLRDLSDLTGVVFSSGVSIPIDVRAAGSLPDDVTAPSVEIELDSHDRLYQRFASFQMEHLWQDHPSLSSLTELAKAAHQTADSASAGYWPTFQLMARTSLDYPNGPILEKFNQTSAGVTVNWPLFDAGNTRNRIRQNEKISELNMEKHDQALADMTRDWNKAMDQIASLEEQKHINETAVSESAELVDIIYKAYKSGARTYLDVENADLQALEAKNQLAITRVHIVMNLVVLASLSEDNNPK
jgi:outer membrane protein